MKDFDMLTNKIASVDAIIGICGDTPDNMDNLSLVLDNIGKQIQDMGLTKDQKQVILNQVSRLKKKIGS